MLGKRARPDSVAFPLPASLTSGRPVNSTSWRRLPASRSSIGWPVGCVPQGGRQGFLCPDFLRISLVSMSGLVAELSVIVSAVALDVNAADTVPKFKGILIFTGGGLAAAAACGLKQGIVRDSRSLVE